MTLDFSTVDMPVNITTDSVLSKISDEMIFRQYFGKFVPYRETYHSVFRKDRNPSTGFYIGESGKLKYKDLGTGESWDCFSFVAKLHSIGYYEAVKKVACDFGLLNCKGVTPIKDSVLNEHIDFDRKLRKHKEIQVVPKKWTKEGLAYWKQYEIDLDDLTEYRIYQIEQLFIDKQFIGNPKGDLRFAYLLKAGQKEYMKIYTPYSVDRYKWVSNIPLHIPFGVDSLCYDSKTVFLTKSLKDMIILRKIFPAVIATQNESEGALNAPMVKHLTDKFEKRVIVWDNDEVGVENCKKFNTKGFDYFNIPKDYIFEGIKDPSDYIRSYGIEALKELFKTKQLL